jgi:hypothetical protein
MRINKKEFLAWAAFCFLLTACPPPVSNDINDSGDGTEQDDGPPGLSGTSWEWSGVKLSFKSETRVSRGTASYAYSYDRTERTGNIGSLGAFSVSEDFLSLTFSDFMGQGSRAFANLGAALIGTEWRLGQGVLSFTNATRARFHGIDYSYSYDAGKKSGVITAEWGKPGPFTVSENGGALTFSNYRDSGLSVTFTVASAAAPPEASSLLGSDWWWTGTSLHLDFVSEAPRTALLWSFTGYYPIPIHYDFTYDSGNGTGSITNGRNAIGTKYDLGVFSISGGEVLNFNQYGPYPHGALFYKQD